MRLDPIKMRDLPPGHVVIGRLSGLKVTAGALFCGLGVLAVTLVDWRHPTTEDVLGPLCCLALLGLYARLLWRTFRFRGVGLFVADGRLYDVVRGRSVPLSYVQCAARSDQDGNFIRTEIRLDIEPPRPPGVPAWEFATDSVLMIRTIMYQTPAAEILERLAAHGVDVEGSKERLFGL